MKSLQLLTGDVKNYDWGGKKYIPTLLGLANSDVKPFAEYWIGDHAAGSSRLIEGGESLADKIRAAPTAILGEEVAARFGSLPYLFKVLDCEKMLSIQAHPDSAQARAGFERENAAGIPLSAPFRNYKDPNSKPEVHVALTEFWMLHGFRPLAEIEKSFRAAFPSLKADFSDLRTLYSFLMTCDQSLVDQTLGQHLMSLIGLDFPKSSPEFWFLRAAHSFARPDGTHDRGLFSMYLLNLLHLQPGEGTFQGAGKLHAYLEGVNVELMANSDNVLRGGLTPKHVDVSELLRILRFDDSPPQILRGEPTAQKFTYRTPAVEFELTRVRVSPSHDFQSSRTYSAECWIVIEGSAIARSSALSLSLKRGEVFLAPAGIEFTLAGDAILFRAAVPH